MEKFFVISLGGSLIVSDSINVAFLKGLRDTILKFVDKGYRFFIVAGGGKICRVYQNAAKEIVDLEDEDIDWLGIHVTHLNAQLLRSIFRGFAHPKILTHYTEKEEITEPIAIGAGWRPGHSTDYDAVAFANLYKVPMVINLSDIDYVYDKDPSKFPNAQPLMKLSWSKFQEIVDSRWTPGKNLPFDPIASSLAKESGIKVVVMDGENLNNFENFLLGKKFEGTLIE